MMMNNQYIRLDNRAMLSILRSLDGESTLNQTQTEASLHASLHLLHENLMLRASMREFLELDVQVTDLRYRAARAPQGLLRRLLRRTQAHVDPQQLVDQRDAAWREFEMLRKLVDNTNRSIMVTPS